MLAETGILFVLAETGILFLLAETGILFVLAETGILFLTKLSSMQRASWWGLGVGWVTKRQCLFILFT